MSMNEPFVMLVDDEVPFVETMTKRLEKRNVKVITAFSGQEALKTLASHQNLDVVIFYRNLPVVSGGDQRSGFSPPFREPGP